MKMLVRLTKGQQVTVPAHIREELSLHIGSPLDMEVKKGKIIMTPIGEDLKKVFADARKIKPKHNLTPKQMKELNARMFR